MVYYSDHIIHNEKFVDLNGAPVKRTPFTHPYNYDDYVIWKDDSNFDRANDDAVYSDRLYQWDYEKYNKCCMNVFKNKGQNFKLRNPKDIEKFLSMYFNKQIKLTAVVESCNQAYGNPYWVFFYKNNNA